MTATHLQPDPALLAELERPHDAMRAVLEDQGANPLHAVAWGATHLAATARVLHPAAAHALPHSRARMHDLCAADHELQQTLWWLDRRSTGDARVTSRDLEALRGELLDALAEHARHEDALVTELADRLSPEHQRDLARRLGEAVRRAPTRPHPSSPLHGLLAPLAFRVDAGADHIRDMLDSRLQPTPHDEPPRRRVGRWSSYLLGVPRPRD